MKFPEKACISLNKFGEFEVRTNPEFFASDHKREVAIYALQQVVVVEVKKDITVTKVDSGEPYCL